MNSPNSTSLIQQLREGDRNALASIYDAYAGMVYGVVLKMIKEEELCQEIVQDVFIKVWKNIAQFDESKARFSTWVINIARNRAIDEIRSKRFRNQQENQSLEDSVNEVDRNRKAETAIDAIGVKSVIDRLRPEQKILVELVYFGGFTHDEAAKELNMPLGTVKTRLRNSILELRKILKVEQ